MEGEASIMRPFRLMNEKQIRELEKRPFAQMFPHAIESIREGKCPTCGRKITGFRNELSEQEYRLRGMCQDCQDAVFGRSNSTE